MSVRQDAPRSAPSSPSVRVSRWFRRPVDEDPCDVRVMNRRFAEDAAGFEWWERHDRERERGE